MIVSNTSAADFAAMLDALYTFLTSNGWTGVSHTPGSEVATIKNSNNHTFYITSQLVARTDAFTGAFNDKYLRVAYEKGDIGATAGASANCICNDMYGPFPNLWFFTDDDATFCHVVAQCSSARYSHCSFGDLDNKGIHAEALPFTAGTYWQYWASSTNITSGDVNTNPFNRPRSTVHSIDMVDADAKIGIPDGLLDPTLFFTDGPIVDASHINIWDREFVVTADNDNSARWHDYLCCTENKPHVGGVLLSPMPVVTNAASADVRAFIGEFPGIALVNITGLSPGQTITFADDEWLVFPIKQYGLAEAASSGNNPQAQPNSAWFGFAYRSVNP